MNNTLQTTPPSIQPPAAKPFPLNSVLIGVSLASVLLTGFFIYQNQLLQKQLDQIIKTQIQITPARTPPEKRWLIYSIDKFSFSYPNNYKVSLDTPTQLGIFNQTNQNENGIIINFNQGLTLKRFIAEQEGGIPAPDVTSTNSALIQGIKATKIETKSELRKSTYLFFVSENIDYLISYDDSNPTHNQILSTFKFIQTQSTQDEIRSFVNSYITAIIQKDWTKVKKLLDPGVQNEFSSSLVSSYNITRYEILTITNQPDKNGYYYATVRMNNSKGDRLKNPTGDPQLMIHQQNGQWSTLTWYFFQ